MSIDERTDHVLRRVRSDIARFGQSIMYVAGSSNSFSYTIGRTERGLPELLMAFPLAAEQAHAILNHLDDQMPEAREDGSLVDMGGKYPIKLLDVTDPRVFDEYCTIVWRFYGEKARVQQVLLPGLDGRYPPDCRPPYNRQPVLGRTTH